MRFENQARVRAGLETLWDFMMDIPQVSTCIPGVEQVRAVDPDRYVGMMRVRVGPVALRFEGEMTITERDKANWRATMKAGGSDRQTAGAVRATMVMELRQVSGNETDLVVVTDANVLGKLGEFGQPVMRKKADSIMKEFALNVSKRVGDVQPA